MSERPERPQYGEYAPRDENQPAVAASPQTPAGTPTQLSGVPHNLGVAQEGAPAAPTAPSYPAQHTPQQPPQHEAPTLYGQQPPHAPPADAPQQRSAVPVAAPYDAQQPPKQAGSSQRTDRIITIVLLVLGAFGAMNMGMAAKNMSSQLYMLADLSGLPDLVLPASVKTFETVGALIILSIYALSLLLSISRLRAKKITFWVPLVAAVVAFIALTIIMGMALMNVPELMNSINQDTLDNLFRQATTP